MNMTEYPQKTSERPTASVTYTIRRNHFNLRPELCRVTTYYRNRYAFSQYPGDNNELAYITDSYHHPDYRNVLYIPEYDTSLIMLSVGVEESIRNSTDK